MSIAPVARRRLVALALLAVLVGPSPAAVAHLTFLGKRVDGVDGVDGLAHPQDLALSPDGLHVYVSSEEEDAVVAFSRNPTTGALTFLDRWVDGVGGVDGIDDAYGIAVSPDGKHVYVLGNSDDSLAVFSRDAATGLLTFVERERDGVSGVDGMAGPENVTLSPDGEHIYVAAYGAWAVAVFARDAMTGAVTFVEAEIEGVNGVTGLLNATTPIVSPDGKHVYVASQSSNAVALFTRDAITGALTFVEATVDGVGGVEGLEGAYGIAISPDGGQVYVGSYLAHAMVTFDRDALTGALTFVEAQYDGMGGIDGINWPLALAISGDGAFVYVAGSYTDHSLVVFSRDVGTGALTFLEQHDEGAAGVSGLVACNGVRVSADARHVYTTARDSDAVAIFATPAGLPTTTTTTTVTTTAAPTTTVPTTTIVTTTSTTATVPTTTLVSTTTLASTTTSTTATPTTSTSTTGPTTTSTAVPVTTSTSSSTAAPTTTLLVTTTTTAAVSTTSTTLPGCTPSPRSDCRAATAVRLVVRDKTSDAKDRLVFAWRRGAATAVADFGDPPGTTTYRLCAYSSGALAMTATVAGGGTCGTKPCWKATKKGFRYADRARSADGVAGIVLKAGETGKAAVTVTGRGAGLPLPAAPLAGPLTVQVQASDAGCWGATVGTP